MNKNTVARKLDGTRIILRKHDEEMATIMFSYVDKDRERLSKFLPWVPKIQSVKDELNYIKHTHQCWEQATLFDYGIFRKSDELYMGNIGIHNVRKDINQCEIGYWILGDFEGQGYMSEALRVLESHVFSLGFQKVEVRCSSLNQRSANVPKACGYKLESLLKDSHDRKYQSRETLIFTKVAP